MVVCLAAMQATMWVLTKNTMGSDTRVSLAGQPRGPHIMVVENDVPVVTFWELLHKPNPLQSPADGIGCCLWITPSCISLVLTATYRSTA